MNQCDGCQRRLPLRDGKYHDLTGEVGAYPGEVMACTADRYAAMEHEQLGDAPYITCSYCGVVAKHYYDCPKK